MKYQVLRTAVAESQLTDILQYITRLTGDTVSALNLLDEFEAAQKQLEDFPESGINPAAQSLCFTQTKPRRN